MESFKNNHKLHALIIGGIVYKFDILKPVNSLILTAGLYGYMSKYGHTFFKDKIEEERKERDTINKIQKAGVIDNNIISAIR